MITEDLKKQLLLEAADAIDKAVDQEKFVREPGLHRDGEDALIKLARALRVLAGVEERCTGTWCKKPLGHEGRCGE